MSSYSLERVGSYRLIYLLRRGQACDLWEVEKATGGDRIAMKFLPAGPQHTKEQFAFLKNEFLIGKQIEHPNVIRFFDFETVREGSFLTLEVFRHPNLKQWIHGGVEKIFPVVEQVIRRAAVGLAALHDKGIVHRDVKPDNFLMNAQGEVKVIDFNLAVKQKSGLAKFFSAKVPVQGTRSYMSPEQIRGKQLDARSDIYSFACMVHELLAGKPPFTGSSTSDLLNKHLHTAAPTIGVANDNVRPEFCLLVQRALSKDPTKRPESLQEFVTEMAKVRIFKRVPKAPEATETPGAAGAKGE